MSGFSCTWARAVFIPLALGAVLVAGGAFPVRADEPLTVYYFERPPYYFTHAGHPTGFLMDRAVGLFALAGIEARYESIPSKRIMHRLRSDERPCCSVGWFRTPERETFLGYTNPIHRDKEMVALFSSAKSKEMYRHSGVVSLLLDGDLVLGVVDGFSYGQVVDSLIRQVRPRIVRVVATQDQMVDMVAGGRFDYMFVAPEEADLLLSEASPELGLLLLRILAGVPEGNTRHIVCSRSVPLEVIDRLNHAIEASPERE